MTDNFKVCDNLLLSPALLTVLLRGVTGVIEKDLENLADAATGVVEGNMVDFFLIIFLA